MKKFMSLFIILLVPITLMGWNPDDSTSFWVLQRGFFTGYVKAYALCRGIGDNVVVFTQEDSVSSIASVFNPGTSTFIISAGDKIYRKSVGETTWEDVTPSEAEGTPTSLAYHSTGTRHYVLVSYYGGGVFWTTNDGGRWSDKNPDLREIDSLLYVYAATFAPACESGDYRFYCATAAGVCVRGSRPYHTWEKLTDYPDTGFVVTCMSGDLTDINRIYIGTNRGLYILTYNSDTIWTKADIDTVEVHEIIPDEADAMLLYAATSNGIYKSEDRGVTWTVWTLEGKDVCTFHKGEDAYYAGTYGEGIYKSTDGTTWEEFNDELTHWGYPRFVLRVHSITGYDGEVIATTDHGVFALKDNKWVEDNYGILPFIFTDEEIDEIVTFYDTLANTIENVWDGTVLDMDGDGKVAILITDVQATDPEGHPLEDYYGFANFNDYDTTFEYANLRDVIYLDYDGIIGDDVRNAFIRSYAELILYAKDTDEETWLNKGLAYFTFPLVGVVNPDIATIEYPTNRNITYYNREQSYAIIAYIYKHYGMDKVMEIANDTVNGIPSIEEVLGMDSFELLHDFYISCYKNEIWVDTVDDSVINRAPVSITVTPYSPAIPFVYSIGSWSVTWMDMNLSEMEGDTIVFNGEDYVPLGVVGIFEDTVRDTILRMETPVLDSTNRVKFFISDDVDKFVLMVYTKEFTRSMRFSVVSDVWSPSFAKLVLSQNALADEFIDLYLYVNEKAYNYELEEIPLVKVTMGDTSTMISMNIFEEPETDSINTIYDARMRLWGTGIAEFNLYRTGDVAGNPIVIAESLSIVRMVASEGGEIVSPEGMLKLFVPKMALDRDRYLTISRYGEEYRIGPMGLELRKSATLKYRYKGKKPNLYYWDGTSWHKVPVWVDEVNHIIWAEIDKLGTYRLSTQELAQGTPLPTRYEVRRPFPNPMVDVTYIAVALPKASHVTLELYNIVGQKIHTIMDGSMEAGYHLITWDCKGMNGDRLTPGVYFMRIKVGPYEKVHKLVILE